MPSTSAKQHRFMEAVANNPAFAKKAGVPQSVGQDFATADKGKSFGKGSGSRADIQVINSPKTRHGDMAIMKKGGDTMNSKMKMFEKSGKDVEKKGMKEGSKADMAMDKKQMMGMKKGGMKKMAGGGMTEATMGKVATRPSNINGVASKGKTKGTVVKMSGSTPLGMKKGGMTKRMNMGGKSC
jgi:hypothetical protein